MGGGSVPDSEAVRSRRKRLHAAGDHSLCRRCPAAGGHAAAAPPDVRPVRQLAASQHFDPELEMRRLGARLARAHEAEPANALLAKELRQTLQALIGPGAAEGQDSELAGLFAEFSGS